MPELQTSAAAKPLPLPGPICDRDQCTEPASSSYLFDWGQGGQCCGKHQFLLKQVADQISRNVVFAPLATAAPVPMARDERTRLKGEVYAVTEELEEAKQRGLDLYRQNERLIQQVQSLTVRGRETELQLRDAANELEKAKSELERRDAEHGNLVDEVERLRTLVKLQPRAGEGSVVEGGPSATGLGGAAGDAGAPTSKQGKKQ